MKSLLNGDPAYDGFVREVSACRGGCLRGERNANPMLRPAGGFRVPSSILFVLEKPTEQDDEDNLCLTMGVEDYVRGKLDATARALQDLCSILGVSYKDIYIINSLLCWQFQNSRDWDRCWRVCLDQGWLQRAVELCKPELIITFGVKALQSINFILGGPSGEPRMLENMNKPRTLQGIHVWPLVHPGPTARQNKLFSKEVQVRGWHALRGYMDEHGIEARSS